VRPVELDDLHGELPRGEEVRRGAVAGGSDIGQAFVRARGSVPLTGLTGLGDHATLAT